MVNQDYKRALKTAERELLRLYTLKENTEREIAQTRQTVLALRMKVEGDVSRNVVPVEPRNLTDACQWVLMASRKPLDGPTVRDRVLALGFKLTSTNPLASVYSVLKRLVEQGQVHMVALKHPNGGIQLWSRAFWWGEYANLPDGWVLAPRNVIKKEIAKAHKRGAEYFERQLKETKAKLEKKSKE